MRQAKVTAVLAAAVFVATAAVGRAQEPAHTHTDQAQAQATSEHMAMPHMSDADFVQMMTKHHQDGIEMAKIAEQKAKTDRVKSLAAKVRTGQERELVELQSLGKDVAATARGTSGQVQGGQHADMMSHMDMMSKQSNEKVEHASGKAVDAAFIDEMSKHHQMALDMIGHTTFKDAKLKQSADKMAASQKRELQELQQAKKAIQ